MENGTTVGRVVLGGAAAAAALATAFGAGAAVLEPTASQARVRAVTDVGEPAAKAGETRRTAASRSSVATGATQRRLAARAARAARTAHASPQRATRSARRAAAIRHPRPVARQLAAARYGWHTRQFSCLSRLWERESHWNHRAANRSSGAYGIPQALPGRKMATKGADWRTNPVTQIRWGLSYVNGRYHSPCRAWAHSRATGWY